MKAALQVVGVILKAPNHDDQWSLADGHSLTRFSDGMVRRHRSYRYSEPMSRHISGGFTGSLLRRHSSPALGRIQESYYALPKVLKAKAFKAAHVSLLRHYCLPGMDTFL